MSVFLVTTKRPDTIKWYQIREPKTIIADNFHITENDIVIFYNLCNGEKIFVDIIHSGQWLEIIEQ